MKIKVLTLKDICKNLVKIGLILGIIAIFTNFFYTKNQINLYGIFNSSKYKKNIDNTILLMKYQAQQKEKNKYKSYSKKILGEEFNLFKVIEVANTSNIQYTEVFENTNIQNNNTNEDEIIEAPENSNVEVIASNIPDKNTNEIMGVKIRNECDYDLNKEITDLNVDFNSNDILIFHTHTCESYTQTEQYLYEETGSYRTTDLNFTVSRVGDELEKYLKNYGFNVIHDKTYHDYPAYNGSYNRSLVTVNNILKNNNIDIVIDLHRDAIGDNTYAPKVKIGDEYCSRIMFVIGTDGGGLYHPNWRENLKFAISVQKKADELYPGLCKPIIVRNSRYNHNVSKCACIIEVGSTGNTLEESINSMKYLAKVLEESVKK